ncbi:MULTISPECIES: hypothetical protein [unclassified Rathayibacter]|uniref:hypothetical protein n=1 Tax=unclassified Rathayibacter TaxID=2609250 RepID=UPI00188D6212|nr:MULTISPECIES: hypothetical protein [unclassified Rathayibacter]MBF4463453.1 hypothetical protein [Rathayibacter sp. VKM Ac-2879]MBF4504824.1 hypothetical protein [Rathayibacter sp. VKM Ac-2878]
MSGPNGYILGRARFEVVAPCVVVALADGGQKYVYRGVPVPLDALPSHVAHLLDIGAIRSVNGAAA